MYTAMKYLHVLIVPRSFLYSYEAEFIQKLLHEKKKKISYYSIHFDIWLYRRRFVY
jgi:hypothetical protein